MLVAPPAALLHEDLNAFHIETAAGTVYLVLRIHCGRESLTTEEDGLAANRHEERDG